MSVSPPTTSFGTSFSSIDPNGYKGCFQQAMRLFGQSEYDSAIQTIEAHLIPLSKRLDQNHQNDAQALLSMVKYKKISDLGETCSLKGDNKAAIENFRLALERAQTLSLNIECRAYINLGKSLTYQSMYLEAQENLKKAESQLQFIQEQEKKELQALVYSAYGRLRYRLVQYHEAIGQYLEEIKILEDLESIAKVNGNIGLCYLGLGEICQFNCQNGAEFQESIAKANGNIGLCYLGLGEIYQFNCQNGAEFQGYYMDAKNFFTKDKAIFENLSQCASSPNLKLKFKEEALRASINLGNCYLRLSGAENLERAKEIFTKIQEESADQKTKAKAASGLANLSFYKQGDPLNMDHYKILAESEGLDPSKKGELYYNLGIAYQRTGQLENAKIAFEKSIKEFSDLQEKQLCEEWQITIFERLKYVFCQLEDVLLQLGNQEGAIKIVDMRLARALRLTLLRKLDSPQLPLPGLYEIDCKKLAEKHQTTFLVYSLSLNGYQLRTWVISADNIHLETIDISELSKQIDSFSETVKSITVTLRKNLRAALNKIGMKNYKVDDLLDDPSIMSQIESSYSGSLVELKSVLVELNNALKKMNDQLEQWYDIFIPQSLKNAKPENITVVPEGHLFKIPFAALRYKEGEENTRYFIEDCAVSIAPSISVLDILSEKVASLNPSGLVIGDPTQDLPKAKEEARSVRDDMDSVNIKSDVLQGDRATVNAVLEKLKAPYKYIHMACHGTNLEKKHLNAVFRGALKLSGPQNPYLYSEDIISQNISAEIVFMNACFSGSGEIYQEGNVGLIWAFLASGAKSTTSCHWPLYDTDLTLNIVKGFYSSVFKGENKAKALQKAICSGLENNRNRPDKWGLLFVSGSTKPVEIPNKQKFEIKDSDGFSFLDFL